MVEFFLGEFVVNVCGSVECDGVWVVVIDSLIGYLNVMLDEWFFIL